MTDYPHSGAEAHWQYAPPSGAPRILLLVETGRRDKVKHSVKNSPPDKNGPAAEYGLNLAILAEGLILKEFPRSVGRLIRNHAEAVVA